MRVVILCVAIVSWATCFVPVHAREWTDASGEHKFEAELISADKDSVRLLIDENQKQYDIPLNLLSKEDQEFVRNLVASDVSDRPPVTSVPISVQNAIRKNAEREWPNNYNMQRYEINNQRAAYLAVADYSNTSVPRHILTRIMASAQAEWPENYNMQKYEIDNQVKGYQAVKAYRATGIPSHVLSQILRDAVREWPENYNMQKYEIDNQVEAYRQLH